jgi:hypothetical protein
VLRHDGGRRDHHRHHLLLVTAAIDPAAWRGVDLAKSREWVHDLSSAEVDELAEAVSAARKSGIDAATLRRGDIVLPRLGPVIDDWADALDTGRGFVLVRGLPVDELGEADAALAYVALGLRLGVPVSQNAEGDLLGHVRDDGSNPNDPTVRRYRTRLGQPFHVDGSDIVGLLCLRPAKSGGLSQIVSSVSIYHELLQRRPDLVPLLSATWYFDRYGEERAGEKPWFAMPIVSGLPGRFRFTYLRWYIDKAQDHPAVPRLSAEQVELLDLVDELAQDPLLRLDMDFLPGDIQLLANRTILHARTEYEDDPDPELRRHLLRLWLTLYRNTTDGGGRGGIPVKSQ